MTGQSSEEAARIPAPPGPSALVRALEGLPHQPPMRLVEEVLALEPGTRAVTCCQTRPGDWYFQGHFPGEPVVPAIVLVELLAQTAGLAAGVATDPGKPPRLRVAGLDAFRFPAAAGPGQRLEAVARIVHRMGALLKAEGEVRADGEVVARGSLVLGEAVGDPVKS